MLSIIALIVINLAFHWIYLKNLNNNTRLATPEEEMLIKQILNQSNITFSNITQSHMYIKGRSEFAQIEIIQNNSRKIYLINLKTNKIIKR